MWFALVLGCSDGEVPPSHEPTGFTIVYQGSVDGEIEPCG